MLQQPLCIWRGAVNVLRQGQRAAEVILSESLDQSAPLGPLLGNVGRGDDLHREARRALHPGLLTQGLRDTDHVHAAVVAVLLRRAGLFHKLRFSPRAQEGIQAAGDAPRVPRIAALLRVVVRKVVGVVMVDQQAPVGTPGALVGVVVDGEEDPSARREIQGLQEQGQLVGAGGTLDELGDLWADEGDGLPQDAEALCSKVLKGKADDLVVEPVRSFQ